MKRFLLAALAVAALPLAAQASDMSYTFVQAGYDYTNTSTGLGRNSHGWSGTGSFAVGPNFYLFGGGSRTDRDDSDITAHGWNVGGGFHTPINTTTDFTAEAQYGRASIDGENGDANSWSGNIGVRSQLAPHFEGWIKAGYTNDRNDIGENDGKNNGQVFGKLGAQYSFDKNWGLVAEARFASGNQSIFVGPRISF